MSVISDINLDHTTVTPGATVAVTVATDAAAPVDVAINGVRGAAQLLQAPLTPGRHEITVLAGTADGRQEARTVTLTVTDGTPLPLIGIRRDPYQPMAAALRLATTDATPAATGYRWEVGGRAYPATEPVLVHDFAGDVDHRLPYTPIAVELTALRDDEIVYRVGRTVTVWSWYQLIRHTGVVQPPVTCSGTAMPVSEDATIAGLLVRTLPVFVHGTGGTARTGARYAAEFTVQNIEDRPVRFTSRQIEWLTSDVNALNVPAAVTGDDVTVPAGGTVTVPIVVDRAAAPKDADGYTVHLYGQVGEGPDALPAHAMATFEFGHRRYRDRLPGLGSIHFTQPDLRRLPEDLRQVVTRTDEREQWTLSATGHLSAAATALLTPAAGPQVAPHDLPASPLAETALGATEVARSATGTVDAEPVRARAGTVDRTLAPGAVPNVRRVPGRTVPTVDPRVLPTRDRVPARLPDVGRLRVDDRWVKAWGDVINIPIQRLGGITEGSACDPDDLPDDVPDNMACQFTGRYEQRWLPGRIVNAKKGDIVLSPGGNGLIGGLLKQVSPPQRYSHTAIMTRNYYELAHSTASDSWLEDHPNGSILGDPQPSDGFQPEALKYLWPGGIIQTAEEGFAGSEFTAPGGKAYRLSCFGLEDSAQFGDRWELIPAMVIKPHPSTETTTVRRALHKVADQSRSWCVTGPDTVAGKQSALHYRFYCYSDAAIAVRPDPASGTPVGQAPGTGAWPAGTLPTVCSSMVWLAARHAGMRLEGEGETTTPADLEPEDITRGAEVDDTTLDGLYRYTATERKEAALWLKGFLSAKIRKQVADEAGDLLAGAVDALSDIADDCANQILNTFAWDWSATDAKDSERWKDEVVDGHAVSPDNLMLYDAPHAGSPDYGLWGYAVPLIYRTGRFEDVPVTQWRRTSGPGTLTGLVRRAGSPVAYAEVRVGGRSAFTGADGRFRLEVDEGRYSVRASVQTGSGLAEGRADVTVVFRKTVDVTIDLADPPAAFRQLVITGTADGNDDEDWADDEQFHDGVHLGPYALGPYGTHAAFGWRRGWGGEVRAEFDFAADWQHDNAITVQVAGRLYEGTSESTSDLDGTTSATWRIGPDETQTLELYVRNDEEDENTWCRMVLQVTNQLAP